MVKTSLLPIVQKYFETDPLAAAHTLETMTEAEAASVLKTLPSTLSARVFPFLQVTYAASLLTAVPPSTFKDIVEKLEPQQGASLFIHLPKDSRQTLLEYLPEKLKKHIQEFLTFPEDSAGRIMSPMALVFHADLKVKDAIQKIRTLARTHFPASYAYVVDKENHLVGVMNMRDILIASPDTQLEQVMRKDVFSVSAFMDREQVATELSKRKYFAAPVVDAENHLLGIIKAERLIEGVQEEATEDLQKMFGAGGDERAFSPVPFSLKTRLPWLYVNLATAFLAAAVVGLFQGIIAKVTILAVFLPIVAGQGGNAGAQSLAVVMRGLVMREIPSHRGWSLIMKEGWVGIVNGVSIGIVTGLIAWWWQGNPYLGVVIGLAMLVNLFMAGFFGAAIPITMKAIGLDPAQCSNIILTTITDCVGFFAFLGFAVIFQKLLI